MAEDIRKLLAGAEDDVSRLQRELDATQRRLEVARERLDLLNRLVHLESAANGGPNGAKASTSQATVGQTMPRLTLEDAVEGILEKAGQPLHVGDIRAQLIEGAFPLPGRGDDANIIVRLRRDSSRFVRTARGTYALAGWNLPELPTRHRKKRVARRQV
jgi:hypothetical protein